jgi:hypothetical protein
MTGYDPIRIGIRLPPARGGGPAAVRLMCDRRIVSTDPRVINWWHESPVLRLVARALARVARRDWRSLLVSARVGVVCGDPDLPSGLHHDGPEGREAMDHPVSLPGGGDQVGDPQHTCMLAR